MTKNYRLIKAKFLDFLCEPDRHRTQNQFADENGVDPATLSEWKKDKEFKNELIRRIDNLLTEDLVKVYRTMKEKAISGDIGWGRLYIQQINLLRNYKELQRSENSIDPLVIVLDKPIPILGGASNESSNSQERVIDGERN
jgi:transcriptional regulator with XRE-family HTH domain